MQFIVLFIALLLILEGVSEIFFPEKIKAMMAEIYKEIPPKALGILYCFIGISLNFAAHWCVMRGTIVIIGSLFFILGFLIAVLPEKRVAIVLEKFSNAPVLFYRLWGVLLSLTGAVLLIAR